MAPFLRHPAARRSTRTTSTPRTTTRATPAIRFRKPSAWPTLLSVKPYFESAIEPELKAGKTVLIAAHGNSLRAIVKMLDNLSEEETQVNIPTAIPLLYELDENFKPIKPRGEYLDPEAAAAGAAASPLRARSEPKPLTRYKRRSHITCGSLCYACQIPMGR